jgi:ATP-dependent phosphofructokinase / diphosphate-dependent phosphofructokinase
VAQRGDRKLALLVGGGPAPGINGVIGAAAQEAMRRGIPVLGIPDGFKWLVKGDLSRVRELSSEDVSWVHFAGGSILRTSRTNPTKDPQHLAQVARSLTELGVSWLVTIGGDDTALSASRVAEQTKGRVAVVHVPKTIDNDLPLPGGAPTFGFETARQEGVTIVRRLMEDARSTSRWYLVVAMGRKAGHLALGIGKAAGAALTLIPEEFGHRRIRLDRLVAAIEGAIIARRAQGLEHGVAVVAEGLAEILDPVDLEGLANAERDEHGHIRLGELPLGDVLRSRLRDVLAKRSLSVPVVAKDVGYELRCAEPVPFDQEYTRDLGYGAVRFVIDQGSGAMVTRQEGRIVPMPFSELMDPTSGRTRVRLVDVSAEPYAIAREYMARITEADLEDPARLAALSKISGLSAAQLRERYICNS